MLTLLYGLEPHNYQIIRKIIILTTKFLKSSKRFEELLS